MAGCFLIGQAPAMIDLYTVKHRRCSAPAHNGPDLLISRGAATNSPWFRATRRKVRK